MYAPLLATIATPSSQNLDHILGKWK
jgi:hypothetical protein